MPDSFDGFYPILALLDGKPVYLCDLEHEAQTQQLAADVGREHGPLDGVLHSVAFANFSKGMQPFHETVRADFLQATAISAFSRVVLARALKPHLRPDASIVSIGATTSEAIRRYGKEPDIVAAQSSIRSMHDAVVEICGGPAKA